MLLVAVFLSGLLRDLPQPVLAAIVLVAVDGSLQALRAAAAVALQPRRVRSSPSRRSLGVLGSGLLRGVLIGAVISLVLLLRRASRPRTTELGRVPGTDYFADRGAPSRRTSASPTSSSSARSPALLYFNVEHVRDRFFELLHARGAGVKQKRPDSTRNTKSVAPRSFSKC